MSFLDKLQHIDLLHQRIEERGKLPDEVLKKINYKFRLEWNYYSNSMEGNSLTRQETRSVMVGNITVAGKPIKDVIEMKGHDDVITSIIKMGKGALNISEKRIKDIHKGIMHEEDPEKAKLIGQWKTAPNYLYNYKNERFDFVAPAAVPDRMHQLINWLNTQKEKIQRGDKDALHPVMVASQFHLDYTTIHPFHDGNGRTARILTNLILIAYGYPPIYIKQEEKDIYYQYLADIQGYGGEPDLFYDFMAGLQIRSLQIVIDAMEGRDIAEPDDWEKQLNLLKKQLVTGDDVQVSKSVKAVWEVIDASIIPLIDKVIKKLSEFDELFSEKRLLLTGSAENFSIKSIGEIRDYMKLKHDAFMDQIGFEYTLDGFKKSGINTFSVNVRLMWQFEQFKYRFFLHHNEHSKSIVKLYHQYFTKEEIDEFVSKCGRELFGQIEYWLSH